MANYKEGNYTASAVEADTNSPAIDVRGYNEIAVQVKFATCTGSANTATLKMYTSNDGSNWTACTPNLASETNASDFSGDNYFLYWPDNSTAAEFGFGKYIRFTIAASSWTTTSVSFTITYLLKG